MKRRDFVKALGTVTALAVVAPTELAVTQAAPVLYGDGIHCDAAALEAWAAGRPVVDLNGHLHLTDQLIGGTYRLNRTWNLETYRNLHILSVTILADEQVLPIIKVTGDGGVQVTFMNVDFRSRRLDYWTGREVQEMCSTGII